MSTAVANHALGVNLDALDQRERAFADSLIWLVIDNGPFSDQGLGTNVPYETAAENEDSAIGVNCGNCVFNVGDSCVITTHAIESGGRCRLAVIPPGGVRYGSAMKNAAYFAADTVVTAKGHKVTKLANGTSLVEGVEVFKAGTFRDSRGDQNTWTIQHLEMIASNFELLRGNGIFPDVPVRKDHSYTIDKVMGYFESLYVVGDRLVADILVTEPTDADKLILGTFRSVSLEVGMYVDNDENPYWPVAFGVAYVDIPAVEGLHNQKLPIAFYSRSTTPEQETNPVTTTDKGVRPQTFTIRGVETSEHAAIQAHITELEARPAAFTFRVNGADTVDFAAVQAHIATLEGFASDTRDNARKEFVAALAKDNKIAAPQVESMTELVVAMPEDQFAKFQASYALAPKLSLTADHGTGANKNGDDPAGGGQAASEKLILQEQLQMHRNAGMKEDEIVNTKAYKRLAQITTTEG